MAEELIESCSSPDYAPQEMELGQDFFFPENKQDLNAPPQKLNANLDLLRQKLVQRGHLGAPKGYAIPQQATTSVAKETITVVQNGASIVVGEGTAEPDNDNKSTQK